MDIKKNLKINNLIDILKKKNENNCDIETLKNELNKTDDFGNKIYDVSTKENDELLMIYSNNIYNVHCHPQSLIFNIENELKSCIIDKKTLEPIMTMFNKIIYNQNAINYLQYINNWNDIVVSECYSGTVLMVYNHNNIWNVSTRTCLDASLSNWNKHKSHKQMFEEAIYPKKIEHLNPELCYFFILTHDTNEVISMPIIEKVILYMIVKKDTFEQYDINEYKDSYALPKIEKCDNIKELMYLLEKINRENIENKKITTEGLIIRIKQNNFVTILKLDTEIYFRLRCLMGNFNNKYITYINMYKNNGLHYFFDAIGYDYDKKMKIIKKIDNIFKTLSSDIFYLYKETKIKKNKEIYDMLLPTFKKILYDIHSIYLNPGNISNNYPYFGNEYIFNNLNPITYYDIYGYLKYADTKFLAKVLQQRYLMKDTPIYTNRNNEIFKYFV